MGSLGNDLRLTLLYKMKGRAAGAQSPGVTWPGEAIGNLHLGISCGHQPTAWSWEGHDRHFFRTFQRASKQGPSVGER